MAFHHFKARHMASLHSCASEQLARAHAGCLFVYYFALSNNRCISGELGALGRKRIHFQRNWRVTAGVERALLEQLAFFDRKHCSQRRGHTQVDFTSSHKNADGCT